MMASWQHDMIGDAEALRKERKLALQRARRARMARIDYYPSKEALELIEPKEERNTPISTIIDRLLLAGKPELSDIARG